MVFEAVLRPQENLQLFNDLCKEDNYNEIKRQIKLKKIFALKLTDIGLYNAKKLDAQFNFHPSALLKGWCIPNDVVAFFSKTHRETWEYLISEYNVTGGPVTE